ncbi:MAG: hypothetical protein P8K64_02220 [Acidimicrobiales bacterium]|nr:hypothetical protein [Acidimicrobiales bacterium]
MSALPGGALLKRNTLPVLRQRLGATVFASALSRTGSAKPVQARVGRLGLPSGDGRELASTTPAPSARRLGRRCCLGEEVWEELVGLRRQVSWNVWRIVTDPARRCDTDLVG